MLHAGKGIIHEVRYAIDASKRMVASWENPLGKVEAAPLVVVAATHVANLVKELVQPDFVFMHPSK